MLLKQYFADDAITLPAGTHVYPFSCALAPTLPSSLEGPYGNIRYIVKYVIERPWKWNQATKTAFTVISPYDLNRFPNLLASWQFLFKTKKSTCLLL